MSTGAQNEIVSSADMAEEHWDGEGEPGEVRSDIVATSDAENKGIEFHVSMRDYTQRDMEEMIVEAAARVIVGQYGDKELARQIEAKCIQLIDAKAISALSSVTAEIIDQPVTPQFAGKSPVTMRELIGLYGREYLTQGVDYEGKPATGGYASRVSPRIEWLVKRHMDSAFKDEISKSVSAAISEIRVALKTQHEAVLAEQMVRFHEALAAAVTPKP